MSDFARAREHMVLSQLNPSGVITPSIVEAFRATPRELFVPADKTEIAYTDDNIDLGSCRMLLEPLILARMIEAVKPQKIDAALCVGGATGYGAAILSQLCANVIDLESDDTFGPLNHKAVTALGFGNIVRQIGNLVTGPKVSAQFDVIVVEGAVSAAPDALCSTLKPGGRLACLIVPEGARIGTVYLFEKGMGGHVAARPLFDAWAPYLPGCAPVVRFAFS